MNPLKTDNKISNLKALGKEYSAENVSLLIGAGFSKNAHPDFPNWNQLLSDMIIELYNGRFADSSSRVIKKGPHKAVVNKEFRKQKIQEIIDEVGYLEIVSLFLNKKGIREAVEVYIEERTPYADLASGQFIIPHKKTSVKINNDDLSLHEKVLEGKWEQIYTTNYDNLLEYVAKIKSKEWQKITNGYDLSFSDTKKNIIKIHGSLRNNEDRINNKKFEFDGCYDHCYIITKEDYDNYSTQHEAFAQLMRISLLKGVFCLVGFSGNDPNFLSWIKWVKDILIKSQKSSSESKTKVYVITIDDKEISKELQLYYANHYISVIPLKSEDIKKELKVTSDNPKELINAFLNYLYESNKKENNLYSNYWKEIVSNQSNENTSDLLKLSMELGFKKDVFYQRNYLDKMTFSDKIISIPQIELALLAISDTCSTVEYYRLENEISQNINNISADYKQLYYKIKNRSLTLTNSNSSFFETRDKNAAYYEDSLKCAFNLDFDNLKTKLENWKPTGIYIINKASLMSLFDLPLAKALLLDYVNNENDFERNKYLAIQTLNFFRDWNEKNYSTANYKNQNLDSFYNLRDELLNDILDSKKKIKPYGSDSVISYRNKTYESIRLLNFFIDTGPQITSRMYVNIDSSKWYQVFKELYIYYPYACFYFSLQFDSEDTIQRISQDIAYSDDLKIETEYFLLKSLDNIIEKKIPTKLIKSTFLMCSHLMCAVNTKKWETKFIRIWDEYFLPKFDIDDRRSNIFIFIKAGLPQLKSTKNKLKIILDCIAYRQTNYSNSIDILYYLNTPKMKLDNDSRITINNFIENISESSEISIAGNLYNILTVDNIDFVSEKINQFLKSKVKIPDITIYACAYFLNKAKKEKESLKKYILENNGLWDNGINNDSATHPDFIKLSRFESNIQWNSSEVRAIYLKLNISLNQLLNSKFYDRKDDFFKSMHSSLLDEMLNFISKNYKILSNEQGYDDLVHLLQRELKDIRGFDDLNDGLTSDDSDQVYTSLNLLHRQIKDNRIEDFSYQLGLLISRFLNKRKEGLRYCFDYLNFFIQTYYIKKEIPSDLEESIILGLNQYNKDVLISLDLDVPKMSKHLISLSELFFKKGKESAGIKYWLNFKKERRFN